MSPPSVRPPERESARAAPKATVFVSDPSVEAERVAQALRTGGYLVVDVPLAMLVARVAVQRPRVILVDADADGALDAIVRMRELPESESIDVLFIGRTGHVAPQAEDELASEGSGFFTRPVDVASLVRKVDSLAEIVPKPRREGSAPPPSGGASVDAITSSAAGALAAAPAVMSMAASASAESAASTLKETRESPAAAAVDAGWSGVEDAQSLRPNSVAGVDEGAGPGAGASPAVAFAGTPQPPPSSQSMSAPGSLSGSASLPPPSIRAERPSQPPGQGAPSTPGVPGAPHSSPRLSQPPPPSLASLQAHARTTRRIASVQGTLSSELAQLLAEAEERVGAHPVVTDHMAPSPEEEIEAVLPEEILAALDEPLEEEEEEDDLGENVGGTHGRATTSGGASKQTTGASRRATTGGFSHDRNHVTSDAPPTFMRSQNPAPAPAAPLGAGTPLPEPLTVAHGSASAGGTNAPAHGPPDSAPSPAISPQATSLREPAAYGDGPATNVAGSGAAARGPSSRPPPTHLEPHGPLTSATLGSEVLVASFPGGALDAMHRAVGDDPLHAPSTSPPPMNEPTGHGGRGSSPAGAPEPSAHPPVAPPAGHAHPPHAGHAASAPVSPSAHHALATHGAPIPAALGSGPLPSSAGGGARLPSAPPTTSHQHLPPVPSSARGESAAPAPIPTVLGPGDAPLALARAIASRTTGTLAFESKEGVRRAVMREGDLVTCASGVDDESLIAFLVARGDLPRERLHLLAGRFATFGRHAGAALVAQGYLRQDQLWPVLRAHAEFILGRAILVGDGTTAIEPEPPGRLRAEPSVFGGSTGAEVFVEVVRRVIAPGDAIARMGGPASRIGEGANAALLTECALGSPELAILDRGRGQSIEAALGADADTDMGSVLYALSLLGVLETLRAVGTGTRPTAGALRVALDEPSSAEVDALDEDAIRARIRARLALVDEGDYFAVLGVPKSATGYEVRRAFLELRRAFDPARILTSPSVADLVDDVRKIVAVLEEAYEIIGDSARRERYRRAIDGVPAAPGAGAPDMSARR